MATYICRVCSKEFNELARGKWQYCQTHRQNRWTRAEQKARQSGLWRCVDCGINIGRRAQRCRDCCDVNKRKVLGHRSPNWKGGQTKQNGYIYLLVAPEARKGHRYQPEHRIVWEAANGLMPEGYIIHHVNGIKDDNRLENLQAMPRAKHNHRHDDHDRRILELEAENRALREQLDGLLHA